MNSDQAVSKALHRNVAGITREWMEDASDPVLAHRIEGLAAQLIAVLATRGDFLIERKKISRQIGEKRRNGLDVSELIKETKALSRAISTIEKQVGDMTRELLDARCECVDKAPAVDSCTPSTPGQFLPDSWLSAENDGQKRIERSEISMTESISPEEWDAYVASHPRSTHYHQYAWRDVIRRNFGHDTLYIGTRDAQGSLTGILAAVHMSNALFGNIMLSMPFLIYGGVLASDEGSGEALVEHVHACAVQRGCTHAEFREVHARAGWQPVGDKVAMILRLPDNVAQLNTSLGASVRAQVKRADRENPEIRLGGIELVPEFYRVFSEKMRDLGTPVYHEDFFKDIAQAWSGSMTFVVVRLAGKPVAAACLVEYRDTLEIPWAAAKKKYNKSGINMYMYHAVLEEAVRRGCRYFDFGRSGVNSSTYRFKKQWGAQPQTLHWYRSYQPGSPVPRLEGHGMSMKLAMRVWKSLPVGLTRVIGPPVARHLPW